MHPAETYTQAKIKSQLVNNILGRVQKISLSALGGDAGVITKK